MTRMNEVVLEVWLVGDGISQLELGEKATCTRTELPLLLLADSNNLRRRLMLKESRAGMLGWCAVEFDS